MLHLTTKVCPRGPIQSLVQNFFLVPTSTQCTVLPDMRRHNTYRNLGRSTHDNHVGENQC